MKETQQDLTDKVLTTKSVESRLYDNGGNVVGHISLFDYDDMTRRAVRDYVEEMNGISIILKSSENSYHVWNLGVHDLDRTSSILVVGEDDYNHIRCGLKRGYWRMRIGPKVRRNGDVYKEPPEFVDMVFSETDTPQSKPHMDAAAALFDISPPPVDIDWRGDSYGVETYGTMTDELKKEWRETREKHA